MGHRRTPAPGNKGGGQARVQAAEVPAPRLGPYPTSPGSRLLAIASVSLDGVDW
jgi:hypothetical protein